MDQDLDHVLNGWEFRHDAVLARVIVAGDGREVLQMRLELGVLQLETKDRPDGRRPHGYATYYDYLREEAGDAERAGRSFKLNIEQCEEADREFMQFYHRRICWMTLGRYDQAVADAEHTLVFMDFVRDHSPSDEFTQAHERYRSFVLFHLAQSQANAALSREQPEEAVQALLSGLERIRQFYAQYDLDDQFEEDGMVQQLFRLEKQLRTKHAIGETLEEQLAQAIADEDYEKAAHVRDALRERREGHRTEPTAET